MKKQLRMKFMLLLFALIVGSSSVWADNNTSTVTTKFSANGNVTSNFTQTGNYTSASWNLSVTWKGSASWQNLDGTKGAQIGSGKAPATEVVLTGSSIPGTISSVVVNTSGASSVDATVAVAVGGVTFKCNNNNTASLTSSATNYTFTGEGTGNVVLTWNNSSDKALYIKSITITYTSGGPYTVTYDANDGEGSVPTDGTSYSSGATVTVLGNIGEPALSKLHYYFNGWNTKEDGTGTHRAVGSSFNISMNSTLYAEWQPNTNHVTLPTEDTKGTYTMDKENPVAYGTEVTLTYTPKTGYESYEATWTVNGTQITGNKFSMPDEAVTVTVSVALNQWVETSLADLTSADVFVIVCTKGDNHYAMSNDNGNSNPPEAVSVIIDGNKLSGVIAERIQWNLSGNSAGYTFYPKGDASKWLYNTSSNAKCLVGTNASKVFVLANNGYLQHVGTSKYIGVYEDNLDWRGYNPVHANIANETFAFYKKVTENVTIYKDINKYNSQTTGWNLIASPVASITPTAANNFLTTTSTYDLYCFDQSAASELVWVNHHVHNFNIVSGQGYLYANSGNVTLCFTGQPYNGNGVVDMNYNSGVSSVTIKGLNLVGNPFNTAATVNKPFYKMNDEGSGFESVTSGQTVSAMQGVFVYATAAGQTVIFTPASELSSQPNNQIVMNLIAGTQSNRGGVVDRAIISFDETEYLPKFQLFENSTKISLIKVDEEYAIVSAEAQGEMPVNFKAAKDGQYTITVNPENVEMGYLHLIDNIAGTDIDLLQTPSYTFNAKGDDYESRFRLVFSAKSDNNTNLGEDFAFFSNGQLIVTGEGTLQVVDMMGRVISTETVNGTSSKAINAKAGVYVLRLINGENVKTQKIVVR